MTGRRPTRSLRRPHQGLATTQIVAEAAKMLAMRTGETPSSRAAGGSTANSIDCPMPMHTSDTKRIAVPCRSAAAATRCS
jgi:hypothetical protein